MRPIRRPVPIVAAAFFSLLGSSAYARELVDDGSCRNGTFVEDNRSIHPAVVQRPGRAYFYDDMHGCPLVGRNCRTARNLAPGQHILLGRRKGLFICAYLPSLVDDDAGWIKANRVRFQPFDHNPSISHWLGHWSQGRGSILRFRMHNNALRVFGIVENFYPVGHYGEVDGIVKITGNRAYNADCNITYRLIGKYILANDHFDSDCVGVGLDFGGVYLRVHNYKLKDYL